MAILDTVEPARKATLLPTGKHISRRAQINSSSGMRPMANGYSSIAMAPARLHFQTSQFLTTNQNLSPTHHTLTTPSYTQKTPIGCMCGMVQSGYFITTIFNNEYNNRYI